MRVWKSIASTIALAATLIGGSPASAQSLSYAIGIEDFGAPSNISIVFGTPIIPLFGLVSYTITLEGTLTDATNGISATPIAPDTSIFSFYSGGAEVFSDPLGAIAASFGPVSYTGTFDCGVVGCGTMQANIDFAGTGGGDTYIFAGSFAFDPLPPVGVPEPGTLALFGLALGAAFAGRGLSRRIG